MDSTNITITSPTLEKKTTRKSNKKCKSPNQNQTLTQTRTTCLGCLENQANQLAHMDYGGCLYRE
jgi:hypothetical protein